MLLKNETELSLMAPHSARKVPQEEVEACVICSPKSPQIPADSLSQWQALPYLLLKLRHQGSKCRLWEGLGTLPECIKVGSTLIPFPHTCLCQIPVKLGHSPPKKHSRKHEVLFREVNRESQVLAQIPRPSFTVYPVTAGCGSVLEAGTWGHKSHCKQVPAITNI